MIGQAIKAMILAQPTIAALIVDRVYPLNFPQGSQRPAITYRMISGPRDYTQDGADGVTRFRFQFDLAASTYAGLEALRDAVENELSGLHNELFGSPEMKIHGCFIDNEQDAYETAMDEAGPAEWRKSVDFMLTVSVA